MNIKTRNLVYFLVLTLVTILTSCDHYDKDDGKVYYVYWNRPNGKNKTLIKDADSKTFEKLENSDYAIDKNNVYYKADKLTGADVKTFKHLENSEFAIDKNNVYYQTDKLKDADVKTFKQFENSDYALDKNNVYYKANKLKDANPKNFIVILNYGKDSKFAYKDGHKIEGADGQTAWGERSDPLQR